eukprot:9500484-Pyramimonas_sp.AAC.1
MSLEAEVLGQIDIVLRDPDLPTTVSKVVRTRIPVALHLFGTKVDDAKDGDAREENGAAELAAAPMGPIGDTSELSSTPPELVIESQWKQEIIERDA